MGKRITVELKNDIVIEGLLHSVDQYLNLKINDIRIISHPKKELFGTLKNIFIRGSVIRYMHLPKDDIDTDILQDATRREHNTHRIVIDNKKK